MSTTGSEPITSREGNPPTLSRCQFSSRRESIEDIRGRFAGLEAEVRAFKDFTSFQRLVSEKMRNDLSALTAMGRKMTADIAAIRDDIRKNTTDVTAMKEDGKRSDARLSVVEATVGM